MYQYTSQDTLLVTQRALSFAAQVNRFLEGTLAADDFRPLRLQNGVYLERHAHMMRIAIPYGAMNSEQLRVLADITEQYDRGYAHFTTRQNVQLNWVRLEDTPLILLKLAKVHMHAIQTSGNCIRNITSDPFAGATTEHVDPRILCEYLRQWSTLHPEFMYLPRKFKFAVTASEQDRALIRAHDVGIEYVDQDHVRLWVGGGLGRTPMLSHILKEKLPVSLLLGFLTSLLRVYNRHGRRDNMYKARIKVLVKSLGLEEFSRQVHEEWRALTLDQYAFDQERYEAVAAQFSYPSYEALPNRTDLPKTGWFARNVRLNHHKSGYANVFISLKPNGRAAPGDVTTAQLRAIADIADAFSFGQVRITHEQNMVLPDVRQSQLELLQAQLAQYDLATPNMGLLTDIISCPGADFCSLASAKSIPLAKAISQCFDDLDYLHEIGPISINISGCINSCAHHHVANIGILGVDKDDGNWYQLTLGGSQGIDASIGKLLGPALSESDLIHAIKTLITTYLALREHDEEPFIATYRRVGALPFKTAVYG